MDLPTALSSIGIALPNNYVFENGEITCQNGMRITRHCHVIHNNETKKIVEAIPVADDLSSIHPAIMGPSMASFPQHDTTKIFNFGNGSGTAEILYKTPDNEPSSITKYVSGIQYGDVDFSERSLRTIQSAVNLSKVFNLNINTTINVINPKRIGADSVKKF